MAAVYAVGRLNGPNCPDLSCFQVLTMLPYFNTIHYGACEWNVTWVNEEQPAATLLPCGNISVVAINSETLNAIINITRS